MIITLDHVAALLKVVMIDVSLSGDNAVVIAMAAATLPESQRRKAIFAGMGFAVALRIIFSIVTVGVLGIPYIQGIGGVLLLWVCWKMLQDIIAEQQEEKSGHQLARSIWHAMWLIVFADLSMSLDNVLAVAGASMDHVYIMAFGLVLSIGFMAVAADIISRLLKKFPVINWVGLALIFYVAIKMIVAEAGRFL